MKTHTYSLACALLAFGLTSCGGCSSSSSSYSDTPEYKQSTVRENTMREAGLDAAADKEQSERRANAKGTSTGYTSDPDYKPTVSKDGDYTTIDGNQKQVQYQGSKEQKSDLDAIDAYMKNNPNF